MSLLAVRRVSASYGRIEALRGVSLAISSGSVVALLGPNGAGKTTLVRTIAGLLRPTAGEIEFDGRRIDRLSANAVASLRVTTVPEGRELFPHMTVEENLELGAFRRRGLRANSDDRVRRLADEIESIFEYFPAISRRRRHVAGALSGGEQQMVAIGRALMARPRLLLLDEPSLGLAPKIVSEIFEIIQQIKEDGVTILLVEQNVKFASSVADYAYVIGNGRITAEGPIDEVRRAGRLESSYLGDASDAIAPGQRAEE